MRLQASATDVVVVPLVTLALMIPATRADTYLGTGGTGIVPLPAMGFSLFLLTALFGAVLVHGWMTDRNAALLRLWSGTSAVLLAFLLIVVAALIGAFRPGAYWEEEGKNIFYPIYNLILLAFAVSAICLPGVQRHHGKILFAGFAVSCSSIALDFIAPGTFASSMIRYGGLAINANTAASVVTMLTILVVEWRRFRFRDLLVFAIAFFVVWLTLSRSGLFLLLMALSWYCLAMFRQRSRERRRWFIVSFAIGVAAIAVILPLVLGYMTQRLGGAVEERLSFFERIFGGEVRDSFRGEPRLLVIPQYLKLIDEAPLLGHGTGFTQSLGHGTGEADDQLSSPHNVYIEQWVSNGLLGLAAVLIFFAALFRHFWRLRDPQGLALATHVILLGFFTHALLYLRPYIVLTGLLAGIAYWRARMQASPAPASPGADRPARPLPVPYSEVRA